MFPHLPLSVIIGDLQTTFSVELTVENVLDGRLVAPPTMYQQQREVQEPSPSFPEAVWAPDTADPPERYLNANKQ